METNGNEWKQMTTDDTHVCRQQGIVRGTSSDENPLCFFAHGQQTALGKVIGDQVEMRHLRNGVTKTIVDRAAHFATCRRSTFL